MHFLISLFFLFLGVVTAICSHEEELAEVFAPLPATANSLTIGPTGWTVESFGSGAYMVTDGGYQALFLVSTAGVILVDAPPTIGTNIGFAIGNTTDKPITHLIYSHSHSDHIGSAFLYAAAYHPHRRHRVEIIAHEETKKILEEVPDLRRPLPTRTFRSREILHVGNQTIELSYKGENHERGNIFIYAPAAKVLMLVDVVFPGWAPFSELAESTNIPGWIKAHDQILGFDFNHYIGGHLGRSGTRADVLKQQE
jgi:glyoxylase-like metal-dependent hydrolase (beta-lactamase superfamily II)